MISDVLSDAIDEIRNYQAEIPEAYESSRPMLEQLLGHMDRVRDEFDRPPDAPGKFEWTARCGACGQPRTRE